MERRGEIHTGPVDLPWPSCHQKERTTIKRILFLIALIGVCFISACGGGGGGGGNSDPASPPPTASVSGTVTFNEAPLAGATVYAFLTNNNIVTQTTTTDANGNYTFTGLPAYSNVPAEYQLWVIKPGYGFYPSVGSGGRVTRADYTGWFTGNGVTDIAIYFDVIDYVTSSTLHLTGANFAAYTESNPLVHLATTGQTANFVSGDDGSLQKGAVWPATRFVDNSNGTVTDNLTGLTWLQKTDCFAPTTWFNALTDVSQLANGACGLSDGSTTGQWRLPNINELESLIDVSASNPALPANNHFSGVTNGIYWSSTTYFGLTSDAWAIRFGDGRYMNDTAGANAKITSTNGVLAVKGAGGGTVKLQSTGQYVVLNARDDGSTQTGVPLTYPRWNDNGNGTVTDTVTGLIWLKKADCINANWSDSITAINSLANGTCGLTDGSTPGQWRMPNRNEMQSLADRMEGNMSDFFNHNYYLRTDGSLYQPAIFTNFISAVYYWTSTTVAGDAAEAWTVYSCDFGVYDISKGTTSYALAVR